MDEKILLVDDEEDIRKFLGISLSDLGYTVHTAANGEEALQVLKDVNPHIVLTDIKMPGMDGIELLQKIKLENPDTEVIMISGHGDLDLAIKSLKYEAADFVTKPIKDEILEIALKRVREKISMKRQIREYTENLEELVREKSARLIELERQIAVRQVVEGLPSAIKNITETFEGGTSYFNEMPCFVSIHNRYLEIVATNQLYRERLGDKVGTNSWEIYTGRSSQDEGCPVGKTFRTGKGQRSKETIKTLSGVDVPVIVHTAPIRSKDGHVELVLEITVDITEVKRLQEELRTSQQKYQELFDEVPCYISVQDKEFRIAATNRRFKEDFGDGIGSQCYDVYRHRTDPCPDCPLSKTFEDGKSHQSEAVVTSKTGEQYNVLVWTAPIRDASGEITQVMEMSTNITQIRKLQDRLTSLGLMIGSMSHGVKGMLTALDGGIYRLNSGIAKGDENRIKDACEVIKEMVGNLKRTVLDILYYAKPRDLNTERVDVAGFASEVASIVEPKAQHHNVEFVRVFDQSLGEVELDVQRVSLALVNFLENAVDACAENKSKNSHKVVFGVKQDNGHIFFDIHDNGMGMDRETREKIFTLFFSSKGSKGTGLGLFIANQIIEQHGGSIKVDSTPGQGSHFSIRIPKILPEEAKISRLTMGSSCQAKNN